MPSKKRSAMALDNQRDANPKSRKKRKIDQFFAPSRAPKSKNPKHEQYRNAIMQQRVNTANDPQQYPFDETRIHQSESSLTHGIPSGSMRISGVVYWMQRDQRVQDNWAMIYAQKMALHHKVPLSVVFCLLPTSASGMRPTQNHLHKNRIADKPLFWFICTFPISNVATFRFYDEGTAAGGAGIDGFTNSIYRLI